MIPDYTYSLLTLIVGKKITGMSKFEIEEVGMVKRTHKDIWLKAYCEPGEYIAYVRQTNTDRVALEEML
jgi:hypothetical protein